MSNPHHVVKGGCGAFERVKTLSDTDRRLIDFTPVRTDVQRLRRLHPPTGDSGDARVIPIETTTYKIRAQLLAVKRGANGDVRLVVSAPRQPSQAMVVNFPGNTCKARSARRRAQMQSARTAFIRACGNPVRRSVRLAGLADITGVGSLGQRQPGRPDVAPNGLQLAPVLGFESVRCSRRT